MSRLRLALALTVLPVVAFACSTRSNIGTTAGNPTVFVYPSAPLGDVVDDYFGTRIADPYRWLEDSDTDETRAWIEAENELSQGWLEQVDARDAIRARLADLWDYERYGTPRKVGGRYFFTKNDGLQDQSVLYVADDLDAAPRVLIDPNTFSADGTISLAGWVPSEDGRWLAYATSDGGSDWRTWYVRDVATGEDTEDRLEWVKFSGAAWTHDHAGFFYARYPAPAGAELKGVNLHQKVYYHRLGTDQAEDELVYENTAQPKWGFGPGVTEDGELLVLSIREGTERKNRVYVRSLVESGSEFVPLLDDFDASYGLLAKQGRTLYFRTDQAAPKGRVIAIDLDRPEREHWREVVPEAADRLQQASFVGGRIVCRYLEDARTAVRTYSPDGRSLGAIDLPGLGTASGFGGRNDDPETFFTFSSYTTPTSIWRYDLERGQRAVWRAPEVDFDSGAYVTRQVFVSSPDGTRVPLFLTHRRGLARDGAAPTLLYGYGGFDISITPRFSVPTAVWLEMGGVFASANLRGGGEYGREWHLAGTKERKQNVFDDFIAAAEWLIENQYTNTDRLAISGRSNGGLLVGACMTQRPELYGACLPGVGVLDMLRYHEFTIGWAWASDYGTSDDPEGFRYLVAYSPLHNVVPGEAYPATLITTADHDDRVVPAHSYKFAAAMQDAQGGPEPILIRIDTRAGHGAGKSTTMKIEEAADQWAFLARALDMDLSSSPTIVPRGR